MYKISSQKAQSAAHRGRYADWVSAGPEVASLEQQRSDLRSACLNIEKRIAATRNKAERKKLGLEKLAIQEGLSQINAKINESRPDKPVAQHFYEIARSRLSPLQFKSLEDEARQRMKNEAAREAVTQLHPQEATE